MGRKPVLPRFGGDLARRFGRGAGRPPGQVRPKRGRKSSACHLGAGGATLGFSMWTPLPGAGRERERRNPAAGRFWKPLRESDWGHRPRRRLLRPAAFFRRVDFSGETGFHFSARCSKYAPGEVAEWSIAPHSKFDHRPLVPSRFIPEHPDLSTLFACRIVLRPFPSPPVLPSSVAIWVATDSICSRARLAERRDGPDPRRPSRTSGCG
jgi:hypothetical protein